MKLDLGAMQSLDVAGWVDDVKDATRMTYDDAAYELRLKRTPDSAEVRHVAP